MRLLWFVSYFGNISHTKGIFWVISQFSPANTSIVSWSDPGKPHILTPRVTVLRGDGAWRRCRSVSLVIHLDFIKNYYYYCRIFAAKIVSKLTGLVENGQLWRFYINVQMVPEKIAKKKVTHIFQYTVKKDWLKVWTGHKIEEFGQLGTGIR